MATSTVIVPRRFERMPGAMPVTLLVGTQGEKIEQIACTVDFSRHGLRIQTKSQLNPGQNLDVLGSFGKGLIPSRVVWFKGHGSEQAGEAGLEFLN